MSKAHIGNQLPIKTCLPVDKDTVFLAHYDVSLEDSLRGIAPIGTPVATLRPWEGKYGGGVAIEEGTENLWTTQNVIAHGSTLTNTGELYNNAPVYKNMVSNPDVGNNFGLKLISPIPVSGAGVTFTLSCWYKIMNYITGPNTLNIKGYVRIAYTDGTTQTFSFGSDYLINAIDPKNWNKWFQLRYTFTTDTSKSIQEITHAYFYSDFVGPGSWMYITAPQLEQKPFPTSYVNGTRAAGSLRYPASLLNVAGGTINLWVYVDPDGPHSVTTNWAMPFSVVEIIDSPYSEKNQLSLRNVANSTEWKFYVGNDAGTNTTITLGNVSKGWHMFTITWGAGKTEVFLDGKSKGSVTTLPATFSRATGNVFNVGSWYNNSLYANTMIDELRIDKVARTTEEIEQWYLSGAPFYPKGIHRVYG